MLTPVWRTRVYAAGAVVLAIWLGNMIAQEELVVPLLCAAGIGGLLLVWWRPLPLGLLLLGGALGGYILGNRGFAQLYLAGALPLLPAELVLLVGGTILAVQSAFRRELPFRRDALNLMLLAWIIIGTGRVGYDVRTHGVAALRDYATVYYAAFFFLAQACTREAAGKRFLVGCLLTSCTLLLFVYALSLQYPNFFLSKLTVRGTPLVFYKGDLVGTFLAIGALMHFIRFEERGRWWSLALSLVLIAATLASNNRASMLGLAVITGWLALNGRWRFALVQVVAGTVAALVILLAAHVTDTGLEKTPLYGVYERVISMVDPLGQHSYSGGDTSYKGENNLFRAVWWRAVYDETVEGNPWLGLGFGHDLADRFVRQFYPEAGDEFSTRSPHNILLSIFGRMGVAGLLPFLAVAGLMARRTVRAIQAGQGEAIALWCSAWVILISACFGVVLEGPMGAVVFWTMLGLANADAGPKAPQETLAPDAAALQPAARSDEVAVAS